TLVAGSPPLLFATPHHVGGTKNRSRARPLREQEEARERRLSCATFPTESVHGCPSFFFVFLHGSRSRRLAQTMNPSSQYPPASASPSASRARRPPREEQHHLPVHNRDSIWSGVCGSSSGGYRRMARAP